MQSIQTEDKNAKMNWMKECQNLRIKFRMVNRTKFQTLLSIRPEGKIIVEQLEKQEKRLNTEEDEEQNKLFAAINMLRKGTKELKTIIGNNMGVTGEAKLSALQKKTNEIESGLKQFKLQSRDRYEELAKEESELLKDMEIYEEKFNAWEKEKKEKIPKREPIRSKVKTDLAKSPTSLENQENEEEIENATGSYKIKKRLEKIDDELAEMGGMYLGWSRSDHDDYLKLRTKHKGKVKTIAFVNEMQKLIPDITAELIMTHNNLYEEYLKLQNEKKELLIKYKDLKKEEEKQKSLDDNENLLLEKENSAAKQKMPILSKEELQKQKEKINAWKKQKEIIKKEQTEKEILEKQAKEKEKLAKIEAEKLKNKQKVQEYKQKKAIEEQQKKEQEIIQKTAKKKPSPEELAKLAEREQATFQKRIEKMQSKKLSKIDKIEREERARMTMQEKFIHVQSKLNEETTAIVSKKREKFTGKGGKDALTFGGEVLHTQMRAVPSWRAGL